MRRDLGVLGGGPRQEVRELLVAVEAREQGRALTLDAAFAVALDSMD